MIKYSKKNGLPYDLSQRTWELLSDKKKAEYTDEGGYEIEQIMLDEKHAELQKTSAPTIEVIDLNPPKDEVKEEVLGFITPEPEQEVIDKPKKRTPKKKANDNTAPKK